MNVLITGATGMIGGIILEKCIADPRINKIFSIGRRKTGKQSLKLTEVVWKDFLNFQGAESYFEDIDLVFYCLGVYTGAVDKGLFKKITYDYTVSFADQLKSLSPGADFVFLSGAGADPEEKSPTPFAKYKGMAENYLIKLQFDKLYIFRPGYIYPVEKRKEPNLFYSISRFFYPLIKLFGDNASITSTELANAMFLVSKKNPDSSILENRDIISFLNQ